MTKVVSPDVQLNIYVCSFASVRSCSSTLITEPDASRRSTSPRAAASVTANGTR